MLHNMLWFRSLVYIRSFLRDESGSAYTLSYVMVLPFVAIFMMLIAETSMILLAKMGTSYAAFAAARSAIVWQSTAGDGLAQQKARQAAVQALTPFANGFKASAIGEGDLSGIQEEYLDVFRQASSAQVSVNYVRRKFQNSDSMVSVALSRQPSAAGTDPWQFDVQATVEYRYSFHVPFLARLFGGSDAKLPVRSSASLPSEAPMNDQQLLGISYASH